MTKPSKLVVVIDTQGDFIFSDGKLPVKGAEKIILPANRHLARLDPKDIAGVLFTYDTHTPEEYEGSPESKQFNIHCERDTDGWKNVLNVELVDEIIPIFNLTKGVFDMWEAPSANTRVTRYKRKDISATHNEAMEPDYARDDFFEKRMSGITHIIIFGVASDYCVKDAITGFLKRGYTVEVIENLTAGISRQMLQVAKEEFEGKKLTLV